jgi:hypothetical protein
MLVSLRHIASLSTLLLVACSGSGSSPPTALNDTQTTVNHTTATYAAPFDPAVAPESLRQTRLVNDATRKPMRFDTRHAQLRSTRSPLSSVVANVDADTEHGADGIWLDAGGSYRALYAVHTVYPPAEVHLPLPAGATGQQTLFAPTTHMPNGACLENGNAYYTYNGVLVGQFYVFDFCMNPPTYAFLTALDDNFFAEYVRYVNRDKKTGEKEVLPYYITQIVASNKASQPLGPRTTWTAMLYNHTTKSWDRVYSNVGSTGASLGGWSIFENYFVVGPCPRIGPKFSIDALKLYNGDTHRWEFAAPQMTETTTSVNPFAQSNCFQDDATGLASYGFALKDPNYEWEVVTGLQ